MHKAKIILHLWLNYFVFAAIHHTLETARQTSGTPSSLLLSLPRKGIAEAEASSTPPVTFIPFVTQTEDQFDTQTTTHSSSTPVTDTQSIPQTLSSVRGAPLVSLTPTALETTLNASKTETGSTATAPITSNTWTPAISASQMTDLKTNTNTTTLADDVSPRSIPAVTMGTFDSPPATTVATDTNTPNNPTASDPTTTRAPLGSSNTDLITTGAILINTGAVITTNTTTLRTAPKASVLASISVQCRIAAITVTVSRNFLVETNIQENTLYLGLQECGVNGGNATHVQLTVAWNECSTRLVHVRVSYVSPIYLNISYTVYLKTTNCYI